MPVERTSLANLLLITQPTYGDDRGFFRQTYLLSEIETELGRSVRFVQGNHARSAPGVLRGFHAEPFDKLVYVTRGRVLAVFADLRPDSPTFAQHVALELGDGTPRTRVFVPDGVGNSYCVLGDGPADYVYEVTEEWSPGVDKRAVVWDDPDVAAPWPIDDPVLSEEDQNAPSLRERFPAHPRWR